MPDEANNSVPAFLQRPQAPNTAKAVEDAVRLHLGLREDYDNLVNEYHAMSQQVGLMRQRAEIADADLSLAKAEIETYRLMAIEAKTQIFNIFAIAESAKKSIAGLRDRKNLLGTNGPEDEARLKLLADKLQPVKS